VKPSFTQETVLEGVLEGVSHVGKKGTVEGGREGFCGDAVETVG